MDSTVSVYRLPLYAKALDFVHRDLSYARLVSRIVDKNAAPDARVLTLFEWTRRNIRDMPEGFPVVDDHVLNIIIRGYGRAGQKAEVFTTLTTYAGVPAFAAGSREKIPRLTLSLAWIGDRWRVFDVDNGIVFRNRRGDLASTEELVREPSLIAVAAAGRSYRCQPYEAYFEGFQAPIAPDVLRGELQMLWPRLSYPVIHLIGLGRREWQS